MAAPGGGTITYTVTIRNTSPTYAASLTKITDTLPTSPAAVTYLGLTASSGVTTANSVYTPASNTLSSVQPTLAFRPLTSTSYQIPAGGSLILQYTVSVPSTVGTYTNTASSSVYAFNIGTASAVVNTAPSADLSVTKAQTSPTGTTFAGDQVTYTLTASNAGPSTATGVVVTDTLPAGMTQTNVISVTLAGQAITPTYGTSGGQTVLTFPTVTSLPSGSTLAYTVVVTAPAAGGTITNTASVTGSSSDPNTVNNISSVTTTVTPRADLAVTAKAHTPASYRPNTVVTYTITTVNNGPSPVVGATLTDVLPAGLTFGNVSTDVTCTVTSATGTGSCGIPTFTSGARTISAPLNLNSGATATVTIKATVTAVTGTTIQNTATINAPSGVTDPSTANNSASDAAVTVANNPAVVTLVKTVRNVTQGFPAGHAFSDASNVGSNPFVPAKPGDVMEYCITYTNTGGPATSFLLADPLASLLSFLPDAYGAGRGILWQQSDANGALVTLGAPGVVPADGQPLTNVKLNASNVQDDAGYYDSATSSVRLGLIEVPAAGTGSSKGCMCFHANIK